MMNRYSSWVRDYVTVCRTLYLDVRQVVRVFQATKSMENCANLSVNVKMHQTPPTRESSGPLGSRHSLWPCDCAQVHSEGRSAVTRALA